MIGFCDACLFFDHDDGETKGWCRRHAPSPYAAPDHPVIKYTKWPRVDEDDWCGDHLPLDADVKP